MKTGNFIPIDAQLLKAPKGFVAQGAPVELRFLEARYVTHVQGFARSFRVVAPGMLLTGEARVQVFAGGVPTGVLVPPHALNDLGPRWLAHGIAWSEEGLCKLDNAGLSGDPSTLKDGSNVRIMGWQLPLVPVEVAWATVRWTLGLGFSAEDFALFATAPRTACLTFLREAAHYFVEQHLGLVHPRERLAVYRKAAAVLPGFSKADAGSAEARALFDEALLAGITAATAAGLLELVNALTEPEGGAASG